MLKTKFTILIISFLLIGITMHSQSQRMVLAEELTSATCGPCASQNPAFNTLLDNNTDIVTSIKYQMNWPTAGGDPMYLHNTVDNSARRSYYGVNSIPWVALEGGFSNQPQYVTQSILNNAAEVPSPFNIQVQHYLSPDEDSIYVVTLIAATEDISGNLVAHNVVVEKEIHFSSPPGTTNEKDFFNVMKKMLPSAGGTPLPGSMAAGEYIILQNSWALENVYENEELAVVAFIQDNTSKDVHQAANSSTSPVVPAYANDAEMLSVSYATSTNCSGSIEPSLTIRNNGSDDLNSATIKYAVNGGDEMTYDWTGNLGFLETEKIQLSEITFAVEDMNNLVINGISTNETDDEYTNNNVYDFEMLRAPVLTGTSIIFLTLDEYPEETTWEILNSAGDVVQSGGPYSTSGQKIEPITVSETDCYEFVIYDAGSNGTDYYAVVYGNNQIAFEGFGFEDMERSEFARGTVGIDPGTIYSNLQVYPNPATDHINVVFTVRESSDVSIKVVDLIGKVVSEINPGQTNSGSQQFTLNTNQMKPGVYLLQVKVGDAVHVEKISIR